jgi:N-acylneuraminate cytidylyltransferase/CMP-N,N'-diacetyllegionaminic acid synthase
MINNKSILGIIPARSGSKRVKDKNIKELNSKPLIYYSISTSLLSKYIDRLIVSTDSIEIANVAKDFGADVPFIRPRQLALDTSPSSEIVIHTINWLRENECMKYDMLCLLQPTSPFRKSVHIDAAIEKLISSKDCHALVSIRKCNENPHWMFTIKNNRIISLEQFKNKYYRKQDIPNFYFLNGAIYIADCDFFMEQKTFISTLTTYYEMNMLCSIDIDDEIDFLYAEFIMQNELIK